MREKAILDRCRLYAQWCNNSGSITHHIDEYGAPMIVDFVIAPLFLLVKLREIINQLVWVLVGPNGEIHVNDLGTIH